MVAIAWTFALLDLLHGIALPPVELPPPLAVIEPLSGAGLLLPTAQEVAGAVILAINRRCGPGAALLADELPALKRLRAYGLKLPAHLMPAQAAQNQRIDFLRAHIPAAPYRVRVHVGYQRLARRYEARVTCHERGQPPSIDRRAGLGRTPAQAVATLAPQLDNFCAVLDVAARERRRQNSPAQR